MPFHVSDYHVDAVVCAGYKWLLGPYGTGFAWINPKLREQLDYNQAYWIANLSDEVLKSEGPLTLNPSHTARKFDVFATANFFNFVPFKASIDYLLNIGIENIYQYQQSLVDQFIKKLDDYHYKLISPKEGKFRSSLIVISHRDSEKNLAIWGRLKNAQIYTAFWKGNIRLSPHIYNTSEEISKTIELLNTI